MTEASSRIERVTGRGVAVRGDDIDTDRIIPARFLRCVSFEGLGPHAFEDDRKGYAGGLHPFDRPEHQGASILITNRNFGCGSSREHAPQALLRWGIRGIIGESFAEIFFGNCVALGMPCVTLPGAAVAELQERVEREPAMRLTIDLAGLSVLAGGESFAAGLSDGARRAFLTASWDFTGLLLDRPEEIDRVAAALPYVAWR
jgi:3-isopropylmalate/(R)-2-methylmalate dehydratase small subunit